MGEIEVVSVRPKPICDQSAGIESARPRQWRHTWEMANSVVASHPEDAMEKICSKQSSTRRSMAAEGGWITEYVDIVEVQ